MGSNGKPSIEKSVIVYKIGGSLLDLPDLPARLGESIGSRSEELPILVCGGGAVTGVVRDFAQVHSLKDETSHWIAMESLRVSARLLASVLPQVAICETQQQVESAWMLERWPLIDLSLRFGPPGDWSNRALPKSWSTTSDSLAAEVAREWNADSLVLIKSTPMPAGGLDQAVEAGAVDESFPTAARGVKQIEWINLRKDAARRRVLTDSP